MISRHRGIFRTSFFTFCVELILYFPETEESGPLYAQNGLKFISKRLFHFAEPKIAKKCEISIGHISATERNFSKKFSGDVFFIILSKISKNEENLRTSLLDLAHFCLFFSENGS